MVAVIESVGILYVVLLFMAKYEQILAFDQPVTLGHLALGVFTILGCELIDAVRKLSESVSPDDPDEENDTGADTEPQKSDPYASENRRAQILAEIGLCNHLVGSNVKLIGCNEETLLEGRVIDIKNVEYHEIRLLIIDLKDGVLGQEYIAIGDTYSRLWQVILPPTTILNDGNSTVFSGRLVLA